MTIYALKPRFQALLRPYVTQLAKAGVTANQVTLAAAIGSVAVGLGVAAATPARWPFIILPFWLFLRMALNAVDGMLAREFNQKSRIGAYLNEISDVLSDAALYAPFAWLPAFGPLWTFVVIILSSLTEFAGVLGPTIGASRRYDGPMGKSDRAFVFGALGLWVGVGAPLPAWSFAMLIAIAVLLAVTVGNRVRHGLQEARSVP